jgi:hypothetical protein
MEPFNKDFETDSPIVTVFAFNKDFETDSPIVTVFGAP